MSQSASHVKCQPAGDAELHALGRLLESYLPFLGGKATAAYLAVEEHPLRGIERCRVCGENCNMGTFTLKELRQSLEMTLPYVAVHALVEHGSAHYQGELHDEQLDPKLLKAILHVRERALGKTLEGWLWDSSPAPAYLEITKHEVKGLEMCAACGAAVNMGTFDLRDARSNKTMSLPFLASHTLAVHGDHIHKGTIHTGEVDLALLGAMLEPSPDEQPR